MSVRGLSDNKIAYKHTDRPPAHCHGPQTHPREAPRLQLHRQCAAKRPYYRRLRSGGAGRPYSVRCLRNRRGDKALHGAYSAPVLKVFRQRVP